MSQSFRVFLCDKSERKSRKAERMEGEAASRVAVISISPPGSENHVNQTSVAAARSPDTDATLELHGNTGMIGSGIKGLIHYLFTCGHFREGPYAVCVCVCLTHRSGLPNARLGKGR